MLVKIIQCSVSSYWYHDQIGKVFDVDPDTEGGDSYQVLNDDSDPIILVRDCVPVISEANKPTLVFESEMILTMEKIVEIKKIIGEQTGGGVKMRVLRKESVSSIIDKVVSVLRSDCAENDKVLAILKLL